MREWWVSLNSYMPFVLAYVKYVKYKYIPSIVTLIYQIILTLI
jgi:hypothetical protein